MVIAQEYMSDIELYPAMMWTYEGLYIDPMGIDENVYTFTKLSIGIENE